MSCCSPAAEHAGRGPGAGPPVARAGRPGRSGPLNKTKILCTGRFGASLVPLRRVVGASGPGVPGPALRECPPGGCCIGGRIRSCSPLGAVARPPNPADGRDRPFGRPRPRPGRRSASPQSRDLTGGGVLWYYGLAGSAASRIRHPTKPNTVTPWGRTVYPSPGHRPTWSRSSGCATSRRACCFLRPPGWGGRTTGGVHSARGWGPPWETMRQGSGVASLTIKRARR